MRADYELPEFARGSGLLEAAFEFAERSHHGPGRAGDTDIAHPVAVARLLSEAGFGEDVVAAALLHDVVDLFGSCGLELPFLERIRDELPALRADRDSSP